MLKGTAYTITYVAWDTSTGGLKTGDVTNHTCAWQKDNSTPATCTNSPAEVGGGVYKITLTSTETNCDFGTLTVTSSDSSVVIAPLQIVFHDASQYKADVSGIPASVWSNSSRTLTASPTDISSLATASAVSTLQSSVSGLSIPTVSQIQSGLATASALSTLQSSVSGLSIPTVSQIQNGLATSSALSTLQTTVSGLPTLSQIQSGLASSSDLAALAALVAKVFALVGSWSVTDDTLTAYDSEGNVIYTGTLTRDTNDQITAITETTDTTEATT